MTKVRNTYISSFYILDSLTLASISWNGFRFNQKPRVNIKVGTRQKAISWWIRKKAKSHYFIFISIFFNFIFHFHPPIYSISRVLGRYEYCRASVSARGGRCEKSQSREQLKVRKQFLKGFSVALLFPLSLSLPPSPCSSPASRQMERLRYDRS